MLHVLSLEYVIALYPLFLSVIMHICIQLHSRVCKVLVFLWVPFGFCLSPLVRRYQWNPANSLIHVFMTFLLLLSSKFLYISLSLLYCVHLYTSTGEVLHRKFLYYDSTVAFFDQEHLPFAVLAIVVLSMFVVLPLLVVIFYPTRIFQRCLNCCGTSFKPYYEVMPIPCFY